MRMIFHANRLYFTGKIKDFRRTLQSLAENRTKVTDFIRNNLH